MKKIIYSCLAATALFINLSCTDFLDLKPKDKIPSNVIFGDPTGVKVYMANLYSQLPIEDFNFAPQIGFNASVKDAMQSVVTTGMYTDESCHSSWAIALEQGGLQWWTEGYKLNRDVNIMIDAIPTLQVDDDTKKAMVGETAFIKAFTYYALAKRYGGVSLIKDIQNYTGDVEGLKVPRSTEKDTWDYVLEECDKAIENLPVSWTDGDRRATKWAALALKSRAALHAASVAKYWNQAPLSGEAVDNKLVGMDASEANRYYRECIQASEELMNSGKFALYKANPANRDEAARNYQDLFEDPNVAPEEIIFMKGFGLKENRTTSHNYDIWYSPKQLTGSWAHPGRLNPTLDLIDSYESYDHPGEIYPIANLEGDLVEQGGNGFSKDTNYKRFDSPSDIFKDRDARFFASLNYPGSYYKDVEIIIQGGLVKPDGSALLETRSSYEHNGKTYYVYGASELNSYSGFDTDGANYTRTGFLMKKFLSEKSELSKTWFQSLTDWAEIRYAEVLLNYAEAVVESGHTENNASEKAAKALNDIRRRAGHTVEVPLTLDNVLRERKIELAFENKRIWDLMRRREYHKVFDNYHRMSLMPVLDLRGEKPQYIFVRKKVSREFNRTFHERAYYRSIPGIATTGIIQNPQY